MTRFVWLDLTDGTKAPVNPDLVAYIRRGAAGSVRLVFGAITGGLHELDVIGSAEEVIAELEQPKWERGIWPPIGSALESVEALVVTAPPMSRAEKRRAAKAASKAPSPPASGA